MSSISIYAQECYQIILLDGDMPGKSRASCEANTHGRSIEKHDVLTP
jgi:hypothetical protein